MPVKETDFDSPHVLSLAKIAAEESAEVSAVSRHTQTTISPMACVDPKAQLGVGVNIGPFCVVGPDAKIGDGCILDNNVTVTGHSTLGANNRLFPGVVIGGEPQDVSFAGTDTEVVIGDNNIFRECVTVNRASEKEQGVTRVGSDCFMMACVHVAHDCVVGDHVIVANGSMMGGHVHVGDRAMISGNVGITHYASVGQYAFVGASSRVLKDAPPYMLSDGNPANPRCVNVVALKRNNFEPEAIKALSETYRLLYRSRVPLENVREILASRGVVRPEVQFLLDSVAYQQAGRHGRGGEQRRNAA